ncbi:8-oxo-dGTP pyrophosphatase MutT (NUDIX family) [Branchiibius hedensis]|uniref:8-oxo-dGTP pyrophosphatase MutT, NUDIX family n=1 Tax=Branchiibius hedensis TaxID=672460 RepID=A0A2Y9A075_9MICO|nr:8-oxo-dGTP pyrophosphatase MutT (NUDIX family) [Branchiibius hedensis]SSA35577.1 8-oxo-dGTP pyrophosphatase MutT, NUDIX family [Branchiibius hedensis]
MVAALTTDPQGRILLVRKRTSQVFMQPGGKPEPGETAVAALRRELQEELQIDVPEAALDPVGDFTTDTANEPGHVLHSQVFRLHLDQPVTAAAEIAEARWFTLAEADALGDRLAPLARKLLPRLAEPRMRHSVRALILDEDDNVLLLRFRWDNPGGVTEFWAYPGGGIEPGESALQALQRELREEVGLELAELGPELWTKTAHFPMGQWDGQVDHIHLLRVPHFEPRPGFSEDQLRAEHVHEVRWWSPDEIARSTATFSPRSLPTLLVRLRDEGPPDTPVTLTGF